MTKSDLIPLNTRPREEVVEIARRGGQAMNDKKHLALCKNAAVNCKCKSCRLPCFLREDNLRYNPEHKCSIPEARGVAIHYHSAPMNEEILNKLSSETIQIMNDNCEGVKDLSILHNAIMKRKEHDYPKELKIKHSGEIIIETNLVKALVDKLKEEEEKAEQ